MMKINVMLQMKFIAMVFIAIMLMMNVACDNRVNEPDNDSNNDGSYLTVPKHFPEPKFPEDNSYSDAKFELGRYLFYDPSMSPDGSIRSCSHCMKQEYNFGDRTPVSIGFSELPQGRNTMNLTNSVYRKFKFWDGRGSKIESPAYRSFFLKNVFGSDTNVINKRLRSSELYVTMFEQAFGEGSQPSVYLASLAISTFVRSFISGNSAYDRFINGDSSAMGSDALKGMELFVSERTNCSVCHTGIMFTDEMFHNTGVMTHYFDFGRFYVTNDYMDRGRFLTPSLRNCEVSSPYMHSGELTTLEHVIEHYNRGGRPFIHKDTLLKPLNLSVEEKQQLIAFLKSLTDWEFLRNKKFSNPFVK